jgi:hypothetical protein
MNRREKAHRLDNLAHRLAVMKFKSFDPVKYPPPEPNASFRSIPVFFEDIMCPNSSHIPEEADLPQSTYLRYFPTQTPMLIQQVAIALTDKEYSRLPVLSNASYVVAPKLRFRIVKEAVEQKLKILQNLTTICDTTDVKSILIIFYKPIEAGENTIMDYATKTVKPMLISPPPLPAPAAVDTRSFEEMLADAVAADAAEAEAAEAAKRAATTAASLSSSLSAAAPKSGGETPVYGAGGATSAYAYPAGGGGGGPSLARGGGGGGGPSLARGGGGGPPTKKFRKTRRRHRR